MSLDKLAAHLLVDRYGDFWLTDAIRPVPQRPVIPTEGFRLNVYEDEIGLRVPSLAAAVSRERLFEVFLELLTPLGSTVDVVLETSHQSEGAEHRDLLREHISLPVLRSHLCDYEDLLLNDGCTGIAVLSSDEPTEVQFDEHKLLVVYALDLEPFERILYQAGLSRNDQLKLILDGTHRHRTQPYHFLVFERLCYRLGITEPVEHVNR